MTRRTFLAALAASGAVVACSSDDDAADSAASTTTRPPSAVEDLRVPDLPVAPFTLGVASGDPLHDRVILWTRLAPEPFVVTGGMPGTDVPVTWEIATDEAFRDVVVEGTAVAPARLAHSVHLDAAGLDPATDYRYRFRVGEHVSPVGRTRTLPEPSSSPDRFAVAIASCQDYGSGHYAAHRHLADEDLDLILFLGDYIYEKAGAETPELATALRTNYGPETTTLDQYRTRYAQYKLDPQLQGSHQAFPWVILWDDHEVANDYAGSSDEQRQHPVPFDQRRAAAYQAWYEHLPVRIDAPEGVDVHIWRDFAVGDLAHVFAIDVRHSSDPIACRATAPVGTGPRCPELPDPARSNLGAEQERWLFDGLRGADATWTVLANPVLMSGLDIAEPGQEPSHHFELWDGFPASRQRVLGALADDVSNPVVVSGDNHAGFVGDLKADPWDPDSPVIAPELLGTSISTVVFGDDLTAGNPHLRYFEPRNGYLVCNFTRERLIANFRYLDDVADPDSAISTGATFVVRDGSPIAEAV